MRNIIYDHIKAVNVICTGKVKFKDMMCCKNETSHSFSLFRYYFCVDYFWEISRCGIYIFTKSNI